MRSIALLIMLAGCAATPKPCPPSVPQIQVQKEPVPVPVACLNPADVPSEPSATKLTGDARNDADLLGAKVSDLRLWGRQLVAMMTPCEADAPVQH